MTFLLFWNTIAAIYCFHFYDIICFDDSGNWGDGLLNFMNLEYFVALVYAGNISRAAGQLYVSPQTLSENLSKLEQELGTPLFSRGRQVVLTEAGERFLSFAHIALAERDSMRTDIEKLADSPVQIIRCGIYAFEFPTFMSQLLVDFLKEAPKTKIKFISFRNIYPDNPVRTSADIIISDIELDGSYPFSESLWNCEEIFCNTEYALIAHHSLMEKTFGSRLQAVEASLIADHSLTAIAGLPLLAKESSRDLHYRMMSQAFKAAGLSPNIVIRADANSLINSLCATGAGAYFGPRWLCKSKIHDLFITHELNCYNIDVPTLYNGLVACWPKGKKLTEAQYKLIQMLKGFTYE